MKTFIVVCLLSAATLASARRDRRLGSNVGAIGALNGELRAGIDQVGPHGAPGFTASIGTGLGARLGGHASLGVGSNYNGDGFYFGGGGAGYPGAHAPSWGGAYGAWPNGEYWAQGAPYGGRHYGVNQHGQYGSYGSYGAYGPYGGYGQYGQYSPYGGYATYGYPVGYGAPHGWGTRSFGAAPAAAIPRSFGASGAEPTSASSSSSGAAPAGSS